MLHDWTLHTNGGIYSFCDVLMRNDDFLTQGWRAEAKCFGLNPELFYAETTQQTDLPCDSCPVRFECLTQAIRAHETDGWWGGLERRGRVRFVRYMKQGSSREEAHALASRMYSRETRSS